MVFPETIKSFRRKGNANKDITEQGRTFQALCLWHHPDHACCWGGGALVVDITPRRNSQPLCSVCDKKGTVYDRQKARLFEYVPIWTFKVYFRYAPRRVACPHHGIKVEALPWGYGKERMTFSYQVYLARWAKRLSWKETADIFETSWDTVFT